MVVFRKWKEWGRITLTRIISFKTPGLEEFEGRKIMTDPGVHEAVAAEMTKYLRPGSSVLEIGAGAGAFSRRMQKDGYEVSAVDISDEHFDAPGVTFRKVQVEDHLSTIYGEKKFQAVVAVEVIEHFRSTWRFFQEAAEVLELGGRLFITTPNLCSIYSRMVFLKEGRFFHFQGADSWRMGHINPVPYFVLENIARDAGFRVVARQGIGYMPVLDWSGFRIRNLFTAFPRLLLYLMMKGPGPKDGNILLYSFEKEKDSYQMANGVRPELDSANQGA